jgi:CRISPR-associated protein Cmr3
LEKGWKLELTDFLDNDFEIDLISAFVGKPEAIGGWNIKEKKSKPMKKAIPAGSTYYFQIKSDHSFDDIKTNLKKNPVLNNDEQTGREGFGLFTCTPLDINSISIGL